MREVPTYCRICEAACGLVARVEGDRVVALRPDPDHPVSRGFACAKGTRFAEVHHAADRLDHPLVRRDGRLQRATWDDALGDIGAKIKEIRQRHGPHAVAMYVGNPTAFSYAATLATHALGKGLGTRNQFSAASLDCSNKFVVARRMLGNSATHPIPDFDRARFALLIGTNPAVSCSSFVQAPRVVARLKGIERRGGEVWIVDPRRTETVRHVGRHVPIVPDTDAALLLSILSVVFDERLEDRAVLDRHADDEARLREAVVPFSPERVAALTGVGADTIRTLARRFARAKGAFCHLSTGVNQGTHGNLAYAAKIALELATGNLDRPGGALLPRGVLDVAQLVRRIGIDEDGPPSRIGGFAPVLGTLPTAILADEILTPGDGQVRALIVVAGNPLLSAPDGERLRDALGKLDLLVCVDMFVSDTASLATHVLPGADWLERSDLPLAQFQLQPVPYVQHTEAVVPPKHERREDWRILVDLARASGVPLWGRRSLDAMIRAMLAARGPRGFILPALSPALGLRPGKKLREHPHGLLVDRERPGDFLERRIATASRRVALFPADVWAELPALQRQLDAANGPRAVSSTLRLFTRREPNGHNSWMHCNPALRTAGARAWINPHDAERLGVASGDRVRLRTETGSIELDVDTSPDIVEGAVAVPHGYGHDPQSGWQHAIARGGANVNVLAASGPTAVDPISGMCRFVGVDVHVERIASTRTKSKAAAGPA